ncbi:amidohydrolase family protein [Desulfoluna spongiiphila]|uniref:N-acyl-D-glutamate deacylase n=1 Tax=Desulfoluna spongiiphila TaxID=419481 RepID=A0A1G5I152_9BACT|nr:amidohydrolase family protein [Desulfoluna spongiiphila]SCY69753.1 N-acyl-D-glutamate deacylase [Desulfoluna spongiiphila]
MAAATDFDVVILNGRVMDPETKLDAIRNVGIKDGVIGLITSKEIKGKETIDATGLVVAPGFIDGHQHCLEPYAYRLMVRDGRTTIMDLEIGAPGNQVADFYKKMEGNAPLNIGVAVAHEFARAEVLDGFKKWKYLHTPDAVQSRVKEGWSKTRPTLAQGNEILKIVDEGLRQGGIGIGSTVGYMRDGVSSREIFELQRLAGQYGRQTGMHFRNTPGNDVEETMGIQEMLANAAALGSPGIAFHFNNPGYGMVHELMVRMRQRGYNVWGEIYPYRAGSTALNAVFLEPDVWVEKLGNKYEETIMDVETGEFYTRRSRADMIKKEPTRLIVMYKMPEEAILDWIKMPGVAIGSDGMPLIPDDGLKWETPYEELPNAHPRFSGSFAKVFRMARENNIPLMQAVSMSSYNYAKPLGDMGLKAMQLRGRMQVGMVADITLFNPETITDNATYEKGTRPSSGIPHVIVNGIVVMKDEEPLKRFDAGQPIRFEPQKKGRFKPLDAEHWTKKFYVLPKEEDFGGASHLGCCDFKQKGEHPH